MNKTTDSITKHAKINQFAIRCFRDIADGDYIAARLAMRARLPGNFLWSAEQAIEKYLKCVLILNRVPTNKVGHDICGALDLINSKTGFEIKLEGMEKTFFKTIASSNADRYLINHICVLDSMLFDFDRLVWRLRQYCQPLDVIHHSDEPSKITLIKNISKIQKIRPDHPHEGRLEQGRLELILSKKTDPAREGLVWNNLWFSSSHRRKVKGRSNLQFVNSPLFTYPELAEEASKFMKIDKSVLEGAKQLSNKRRRGEVG